MSENKTKATDQSVEAFLNAVEHPVRRENALEVMQLMRKVTGVEPRMWGATMIGFGHYHYKYDSGREGDCFIIGLSPRKANLTLYIMPGYQDLSAFLDRLGKHTTGKCCLYINKLADIDMAVLEELLVYAWQDMKRKYPN
ncbi:MAG: DUF1801 domain-containing protein [Gammaproteobacteria bacterium]|nr:DUF1801 domain-containing protein [Gammaproteobacteria bacterium]